MAKGKNISEEEIKNMVSLYESDPEISITKLSEKVGYSITAIYNRFVKMGIKIKGKSELSSFREKEFRSFTDDKDELVKICRQCEIEKSVSLFTKSKDSVDGVKGICNDCRNQNRRSKYLENPEEICSKVSQKRKDDPARHRGYDLKKRFKITLDQFEEIFNSQGRVCAACKGSDPGTPSGSWCVDHDHKCCSNRRGRTCGKCIRAILCRWCNLTLGNSDEDPNRLRELANYLEKFSLPTVTR